jgi:hypothetical protein
MDSKNQYAVQPQGHKDHVLQPHTRPQYKDLTIILPLSLVCRLLG